MNQKITPHESIPNIDKDMLTRSAKGETTGRVFQAVGVLAVILPLAFLVVVLADALVDGSQRIGWDFLVSYPSRIASEAGFLPAIVGSAYLMILTAIIAIPVGVGAALYLEEYSQPGRLTNLIEVNISNLAGIPSIIYGLLGLELFVRVMQLNRSLVAGAMTLALLALPIIIVSAREALRTVPHLLREAGTALGADRWQVIRHVVLPLGLPGVLTGIILAIARVIGETAPLITIGALTYVAFLPRSLDDPFTAMPIQIFNWVSRPQADFHTTAAAGIVVLLAGMLIMNAGAIYLRFRLQKKMQQ